VKRTVGDTLLLMLGFVVSFVLCVEIVVVAVVAVGGFEVDVSRLTATLAASTQIILGAVLGYATGRSQSRPPE
jgi:hypothetical protein